MYNKNMNCNIHQANSSNDTQTEGVNEGKTGGRPSPKRK